MRVKLKLIILCFDFNSKSYSCIYDKDGFPSKYITKDSISNNLETLLKNYLDTDPTWIDNYLLDSEVVTTKSSVLNLYYTCLIPSIITTKKGKWINVEQIEREDQKLIFEAIQKTIR